MSGGREDGHDPWNGGSTTSTASTPADPSVSNLTDSDWKIVIDRIKKGRCTPFLGAGAAAGPLPLAHELAEEWAQAEGYPLEDSHDLARVAQFLGVNGFDALHPKEMVCEVILAAQDLPDFTRTDNAHGLLSRLPIPLVITTNYDDFMRAAFKEQEKDAQVEICRWNSRVEDELGPLAADRKYTPTPANPVVYHLHGHHEIPESIVLTEDDYLDFLVAVARKPDLLPHQIRKALAGTSLMFIGYGLKDWDFRVLHRGVVMSVESGLRPVSVTVQLPRTSKATDYLDKYFGNISLKVFWGSAEEFATELWKRWKAAGP
jgi:hypothetical protein